MNEKPKPKEGLVLNENLFPNRLPKPKPKSLVYDLLPNRLSKKKNKLAEKIVDEMSKMFSFTGYTREKITKRISKVLLIDSANNLKCSECGGKSKDIIEHKIGCSRIERF